MQARFKRLGTRSEHGKQSAMMPMFHAGSGEKRHAHLQSPPSRTNITIAIANAPQEAHKKRAPHPSIGNKIRESVSRVLQSAFTSTVSSLYKLNRQDFVGARARDCRLCFRGGNNAPKPSLTHVISSAGGSHTTVDGACGCCFPSVGKSILLFG